MKTLLFVLLAAILLGTNFTHPASAQFQAGGVNKAGTWYVGEGLKKGQLFSYDLCHIDYKDCTPFQIDFWVKGDKKVGSETQWLTVVVVRAEGKIYKGEMTLGKLVAEPGSSDASLLEFPAAFRSSLSWMSAYATADATANSIKGPKKFTAPSWGRIGNIGGEQIIPTAEEQVAVPAGIFDTVLIQWKTGGQFNHVWILDDFPFPIKADTYAHVAQGVPPQEYHFELLDYEENVSTDPFANVKATPIAALNKDCPQPGDTFGKVSDNTNTSTMIVNVKYSPPRPMQGCAMDMIIEFKRPANQEEFENQVNYDILVVQKTPDGLKPIRSIANEEAKDTLFTTSGQVRRSVDINESGKSTYAIFVYGTGPEGAADPAKAGYITFDIDVVPSKSAPSTPTTCAAGTHLENGACVKDKPTTDVIQIPSWIKNNAKFWSDGKITDSDFVSGIQYLINQKIIKIPSTSASSGEKTNTIPAWVKNAAKFWADGQTTDKDFVNGLQFLITNGIIKLKS